MGATLDADKKRDWKGAPGQNPAAELEDFSQPSGVAVTDAAAPPPPAGAVPTKGRRQQRGRGRHELTRVKAEGRPTCDLPQAATRG